MRHVSSRSGVATLRTAIHLVLNGVFWNNFAAFLVLAGTGCPEKNAQIEAWV